MEMDGVPSITLIYVPGMKIKIKSSRGDTYLAVTEEQTRKEQTREIIWKDGIQSVVAR